MKRFYICLTLEAYKNNPDNFKGLIRQLNERGILVTDAEEAPFVDSKTGKPVFESLLLLAEEIIPGSFESLQDYFSKKRKEEYTFSHNGLPMLM